MKYIILFILIALYSCNNYYYPANSNRFRNVKII